MKKKSKNNRKKMINTDTYNLEGDQPYHPDFRSLTLRQMETLEYLNGSNMPASFKFRDVEIQKIRSFLNACLQKTQKGYRFLMVTGSPGAGKTLSINSVLKTMECDVIRINANMVKTIQDVQSLISLKLLGDPETRTAPQIIRELEQIKYKKSCLVYVQEIELLFKSHPNAVTDDFLSLFLKKSVNLILLGISNTIDTIQKYSSRYSFSVKDIQNVVFKPYTHQHIKAILMDKLNFIDQHMKIRLEISERLLVFAAKKLETLKKGDFRICIQFVKELAKESFQKGLKKQELEFQSQKPQYNINIDLINLVLQKMQISKNSIMTDLSQQQKIILVSLYTITTKTQALVIPMKTLHKQISWIYSSLHLANKLTPQQIKERLSELEQYSIIDLRKNKTTLELEIILKVCSDEIKFSLEQHPLLGKFLDLDQEKP